MATVVVLPIGTNDGGGGGPITAATAV